MNRLGMMVDISHVADKTFWDAIVTTKAPVIASHSSARALVNAPRNMTDDMLRAVAKNGGVVQVNFFFRLSDEDYRKAMTRRRKDQDAAVENYGETLSGGQALTTWKSIASNGVDGEDPAPAAEFAHRPHRSHRQSCRRGPCRPRDPTSMA